jgi:hypothetical protein
VCNVIAHDIRGCAYPSGRRGCSGSAGFPRTRRSTRSSAWQRDTLRSTSSECGKPTVRPKLGMPARPVRLQQLAQTNAFLIDADPAWPPIRFVV